MVFRKQCIRYHRLLSPRSLLATDQNDHGLVPLQEHLINQTTNPHVTRIRGAPCKRRMKNGMEMFKKIRNPMNLMEGSTNETN